MVSFIISLAYLGGALLFCVLCMVVGRTILNFTAPNFHHNAFFSTGKPVVYFSIGLAGLLYACSILGLLGLLGLPAFIVLLFIFSPILNWPYAVELLNYIVHFSKVPLALLSMLFLISTNALIGAMVPDMSQDSMWYHLSVPQEWSFSGKLDAFPSVFPSYYPLAMESFYVVLLSFGGEVLCSVFYVTVGIVLLCAPMMECLEKWYKKKHLLATLTWIPLYAVCLIAPIGAGNDLVASLFLFMGLSTISFCLSNQTCDKSFIFIGLLLGQAVAVKPICAPFIVSFFLFHLIFGIGKQDIFYRILRLSIWAFIFYSPWAIRGVLTSGLPVFPLGAGILPVQSESLYALQASKSLNSLYPFTMEGIYTAFTLGIPQKLRMAFFSGDVVLSIFSVFVILHLILVPFKKQKSLLLFMFVLSPFLMLQGSLELLRYFTMLYPFGFAILYGVWSSIADHTDKRLVLIMVYTFSLIFLINWASRQHTVSNFPTMQWEYRPLLSKDDVRSFAKRAEGGRFWLLFDAVRDYIPKEDKVFLPFCPAPYYLHRRALWNDYAVKKGGIDQRWESASVEEAKEILYLNQIDWILYQRSTDVRTTQDTFNRLISEKILIPHQITHPSFSPRLFQVNSEQLSQAFID